MGLTFTRHFLLLGIFVTCLLLIHSHAFAEYRAFELEIQNPETGQSRVVTTTLDHLQYAQIHPLQPGETVLYKRSWMCWENTSRRAPCQPLSESTNE